MRDGHAAASAQAVGRQDLFARAALRVDAFRGESYGAARAGRASSRGAEGGGISLTSSSSTSTFACVCLQREEAPRTPERRVLRATRNS